MKTNKFFLILTIILYVYQGNAQNKSTKIAEIKIQTSGHCSECKKNIEQAMTFEKGVKEANFDISNGILNVSYHINKTDPDKIRKAITLIGYDADTLEAEPKAYEKLKACCKKDGKDLMK